jgi:phosphate starvation-inducible membrane PsiE
MLLVLTTDNISREVVKIVNYNFYNALHFKLIFFGKILLTAFLSYLFTDAEKKNFVLLFKIRLIMACPA